jgi:uncharacterized protein YjiS (DUF1127 family)
VLNSPRSTSRIAQRYDVSIPELRFDWRDKRGSAHEELTRTSRTDAAANSLPNEMPSVMPADRQETAFWPAVIRYLMERFALYGASVYPTGCFPEILRSNEKKTQQTRKVVLREHGYLSLVLPIASDGVAGELERDTNLATSTGSEAAYAEDKLHEFDGVVSLQNSQSNRSNWLTSSWEVVATLWTHGHREREIKKAVAALAKLDDRTLRDLGIPQRSQIEQVVRYCRDC